MQGFVVSDSMTSLSTMATAGLGQTILDISKLDEVLEILKLCNFPNKRWFQFGLKLRLSHATLTAIEAAHERDLARCLLECLSQWLTKADEYVGPLTWQTLVAALFGISENAVAEEFLKMVANPACQLLHHYNDRLTQISLPEESIQLLYTEGVISNETVLEVKSRYGLLVGSPLRAIRTMVAKDHNKLRVLATVLLRFDETRALAKELLDNYDRAFPPGVSFQLPTEDHAIASAVVATGDHTVGTDDKQDVVVIDLYRDDQVEFDRMRTELGSLLYNIAPLIEESIMSVKDLKSFLRKCRPELKPQLAIAETFDDVMEVIEEKCSVVNITLLEGIVSRYAISDANEFILAYKRCLDEFCNRENSLRICNNVQLKTFSSSHLVCETIKFTLNWEMDDYTFNDIRDLLSKAFKEFARRVEVVTIKEGNSITIICYAPHYLMESLLLIATENLDLLKEMGLKKLSIGYYTVYDQQIRVEEMRRLQEENNLLMEQLALFKTEKDDHDADSETAILRQSLQEKESEIEEFKLSLAEKEKEIETLHSFHEMKDKQNTDESALTTESELREKLKYKEKITRAMVKEIEQLQVSLQTKAGLEEVLVESKREIELLQEKVSSLNVQLIERDEKIQQLQESIQSLQSQLIELRAQLLTEESQAPSVNQNSEQHAVLSQAYTETIPADISLTMPSGSKPSANIGNSREDFKVVAILNWPSAEKDELSFYKGQMLTILDSHTSGWWLARNDKGDTGLIPYNHVQRVQQEMVEEWYFPDMTQTSADNILKQKDKDGMFVVLKSTAGYMLLVCYKGQVYQYLIHKSDKKYYIVESHCFATVSELIDHYRLNKGGLVAVLTHPPITEEYIVSQFFQSSSDSKWRIAKSELSLGKQLHNGKFSVRTFGLFSLVWKLSVNQVI